MNLTYFKYRVFESFEDNAAQEYQQPRNAKHPPITQLSPYLTRKRDSFALYQSVNLIDAG